jgi:hypothetical protein
MDSALVSHFVAKMNILADRRQAALPESPKGRIIVVKAASA